MHWEEWSRFLYRQGKIPHQEGKSRDKETAGARPRAWPVRREGKGGWTGSWSEGLVRTQQPSTTVTHGQVKVNWGLCFFTEK